MWHTLQLKVVTPVFNSAGTQGTPHLNTRPELRVSSLRGGMRFWLRAMAARYVGDDPRLLRKVEDACLGSTERSSPIALRVSGQPKPAGQNLSEGMSPGEQTWIGYLLGQAFTTRGKPATQAYIPSKRTFQIKVRRQHGDNDHVTCALAALWLNITYGGLGARVRRGFGQLEITGADIDLAGWNDENMRTPALDHYLKAGNTGHIGVDAVLPTETVEALHRVCAKECGQDPSEFQLPDHRKISTLSSLGEGHTIAGLSAPLSASTWHRALAHTGKELRYFRARRDEEHTDNDRGPHIKTDGWKDVIWGQDHKMPRAALGLPIGYKGEREVRAFRGSPKNPDQLRRSSPLWLRPISENGQWYLFSFAFLNEFLPTSGEQRARVGVFEKGRHKKNITVTDEDIRAVAQEWTEGLARRSDAFSHGRPQ